MTWLAKPVNLKMMKRKRKCRKRASKLWVTYSRQLWAMYWEK